MKLKKRLKTMKNHIFDQKMSLLSVFSLFQNSNFQLAQPNLYRISGLTQIVFREWSKTVRKNPETNLAPPLKATKQKKTRTDESTWTFPVVLMCLIPFRTPYLWFSTNWHVILDISSRSLGSLPFMTTWTLLRLIYLLNCVIQVHLLLPWRQLNPKSK